MDIAKTENYVTSGVSIVALSLDLSCFFQPVEAAADGAFLPCHIGGATVATLHDADHWRVCPLASCGK